MVSGMKLYVDITNLIRTEYITGVQRVVHEVTGRLCKHQGYEVVLLEYYNEVGCYRKVNTNGVSEDVFFEDFECGSVFFDIDNVWNMWVRRSSVLPRLKQRGVKIALFLHDIIPVTHPAYVHENTIVNFMDYLGSHLLFGDLIVASTKATQNALDMLTNQLGITGPPVLVDPLGSDLERTEERIISCNKALKNATESGKYVLMVGTIEPRKNHSLILKAFERNLFDQGLNLIIAGRWGWQVEELKDYIMSHPRLGSQLFLFSELQDQDILYLYQNAYLFAFPSFVEGYGLPVVEALTLGTPVLASNIDVLRELGQDWCNYFDPHEPEEFIHLVMSCLESEAQYEHIRKKIMTYEPVSWNKAVEKMINNLNTLKSERRLNKPILKQIVILTARFESIMQTLPFIENFMPFIQELVLCCPDQMKAKVSDNYQGRLRLKILTDSEVLDGKKLPEDHTRRNFFLRCLAMQSTELDESFLMSDDDYRPLFPINNTVFYQNDKYIGYYFYQLSDWIGAGTLPTSFDRSMARTYKFLKEQKYPCYQFSSHMPQIIHKGVYQEMLQKHPDIWEEGLDEWSTYFNYMIHYYGGDLELRPYVTLMWPGYAGDWQMKVQPTQYLFENFYPEHYEKGQIFEEFSKEWTPGIREENLRKIVLFMNRQAGEARAQGKYEAFQEIYQKEHKEKPAGTVILGLKPQMILPEYLFLTKNTCHPVEFSFIDNESEESECTLEFRYLTLGGNALTDYSGTAIESGTRYKRLVVWGMRNIGTYLVEFRFTAGTVVVTGRCQAVIMQS